MSASLASPSSGPGSTELGRVCEQQMGTGKRSPRPQRRGWCFAVALVGALGSVVLRMRPGSSDVLSGRELTGMHRVLPHLQSHSSQRHA